MAAMQPHRTSQLANAAMAVHAAQGRPEDAAPSDDRKEPNVYIILPRLLDWRDIGTLFRNMVNYGKL
jgi:hypothetical protein